MDGFVKFAIAVTLVVACPAVADATVFLSPPNTGFSLKGLVSFESQTGNTICKVLLSGDTAGTQFNNNNAGVINEGIVLGPCGQHRTPRLSNFPWTIRLMDKQGGVISKFGYFFEGYSCTYNVPIRISKSGVWTIDGTLAGCNISGNVNSRPSIRISK